ncbi:hypothetical protein AAC387_Pa11g0554 [Persea americana]
MHSDATESEQPMQKGSRRKGPSATYQKKDSVAYALLITLYSPHFITSIMICFLQVKDLNSLMNGLELSSLIVPLWELHATGLMMHYADGRAVVADQATQSNVLHAHKRCIEWIIS